jgi:hypothetical protein
MAVNEELLNFVRDALARELSRDQIEDALLKAGWESDQVKIALAAFAEIEFPIPVPRPKPYLSAREAFMYLVLFSTLYITAYHLVSLIFQFINRAFPDPVTPAGVIEQTLHEIRWAVASLIIAFPVFLYVSRLLSRAVGRDPSKRASKVRKWLTYITLFIAASVIICDLIALINNFLGGELSVRFLLKVLTVGIIAGGVFGYYLWDIRTEELEMKWSGKGIFAVAVAIMVVTAVAGGLILIGSPSQERIRRIDAQRVADLSAIASNVDLYWTRHKSLPASLTYLSKEQGGSVQLLDRDTKQPYEYRMLSDSNYELCAHFAQTPTDQSDTLHKNFWAHGQGRQCFNLKVQEVKR